MVIHIVSVGHKMPDWVKAAVDDFVKRFPPDLKVKLIQIPLIRRGKNPDLRRIVRDEGEKILAVIPDNSFLVALDVTGKTMTTEALSQQLKSWIEQGQDVTMVIGGPDGLAQSVLNASSMKLSLSNLTFPHTLAKVMLIEQLYRSLSILKNHPYHRA